MRRNNKIIYYEDGKKVHFFHSADNGLCINASDGVQVLLKDAYHDFDVCRLGNEIYLICQNMQGDLIFLKYFDSKWHKYTLLLSKVKQAYEKNFYLLATGSCMQLFYTIKSAGKCLLVQQILGKGAEPVVIGAVHEGTQPFYAVADSELNTYIYYQNENGSFGYKMYKWSSKALGDFCPLKDVVCTSVYAVIDSYGRHHICAVHSKSIVYFMRGIDGAVSAQASIACSPHQGDVAPYIGFYENKIFVIWQQQRSVMYAISSDNAESFSSPVRIMSTASEPVMFSVQRKHERCREFGYFVGDDIRFFSVGASGKATPTSQRIQEPDRHIIRRSSFAESESIPNEITRLKSAVSALGQEVSALKNRLELALSLIENGIHK